MIGIIVAMKLEADKLLEVMENKSTRVISGVEFTSGSINGVDAVVAVCGVGKVFAAICAEAMILNYNVSRIINSGVAGALTDKTDIADMVIATSSIQHDMDTSPLGDPRGLISGINIINLPCDVNTAEKIAVFAKEEGINCLTGVIVTGDKFVHSADEKKSLANEFSALACEMEGGAIAQVCYVNNVPCNLVRTISDSMTGGSIDFEKFKYIAADNCNKVILGVLKNIN